MAAIVWLVSEKAMAQLARPLHSWRDLLISVPYRVAIGTPVTSWRGWRSSEAVVGALLSHDGDDPFPLCVTIVTLEKFEDRVIVSYGTIPLP
jgi:hypothetical protein